MAFQHSIQRLGGEQMRLSGVKNLKLRIGFQLIEVIPHETKTETVKCADVGRFPEERAARRCADYRVAPPSVEQSQPNAVAHFSRCGVREGHHQDSIQQNRRLVTQQTIEATLHQGLGLAGAGTGENEHVALGANRMKLVWGEAHIGGGPP